MTREVTAHWQALLAEAEQLKKLMEAGDWLAVEQAMAGWQGRLRALAAVEVPGDEAEAVRALVTELKSLNAVMDTLAGEARSEVLKELRARQQGDRMKDAYRRNKRPL